MRSLVLFLLSKIYASKRAAIRFSLLLKRTPIIVMVTLLFASCNLTSNQAPTAAIAASAIINSVNVEKTSVETGENFEVSVDAEDEDGTDSDLIVMVNGKACNPALVHFNSPGKKKIIVVAKNPLKKGKPAIHTIEVDVAEGRHKHEKHKKNEELQFTATPRDDNREIFDFEITGPDDLAGNCIYLWQFGDHTMAKTKNNTITHDYRKRTQDRLISTFMVKVTALKYKHGFGLISSRQAISIVNYNYWASKMGSPTVPVRADKFAVLSGTIYTAAVEFNNFYRDDVVFDEARIEIASCSGGSPQTFEVNARDVLNNTDIPSQRISNRTLRLDTTLVPAGSCVVSVTLSGVWEDDMRISARIDLDIPPSLQTPGSQNFETVKNQLLIDKLNRAATILGPGKPITPAELDRLEKEGKL